MGFSMTNIDSLFEQVLLSRFVDQEKLELYIWTPTCATPTPGSIRMKVSKHVYEWMYLSFFRPQARDWAISNTENPFAHKPECFDEEEDEEVSRFAVGGNCTHLNPNKFSTKPTGEGAVILQDIDIFGAAVVYKLAYSMIEGV